MPSSLSRKDLIEFIKNNKEYLQTNLKITEIGIFGSFARNEQDTKSDIDLIVEFEEGITDIYEHKLLLKQFFKDALHRETDVARKKCLKPRIKSKLLQEAIYV
jgi:predicted nucleotidyltransferase